MVYILLCFLPTDSQWPEMQFIFVYYIFCASIVLNFLINSNNLSVGPFEFSI